MHRKCRGVGINVASKTIDLSVEPFWGMHTAPPQCSYHPMICCSYPSPLNTPPPPRVSVQLQWGKALTASRSLLLLTCAPEWFSADYLKRLSNSFINGERLIRLSFSFVLIFYYLKKIYFGWRCLLDLSWKQLSLKRSPEKVACPLRRKKSECKFVINLRGGMKASSNL